MVMMDRQAISYYKACQIIITANWQLVDGMIYSDLKNPGDIANKRVELHQQNCNILVDIDKGEVLQVAQRAGRVITDTARSGLVRANVNMFIPNAILIEPGAEVRWSNPSNLPHNVVGVFSQTTESDGAKSTGIIADNPTNANANSNKTNLKAAEVITIDSGFIEPGAS